MPHPVDVHVGKRIRHRRWLVGMTQQQLAENVGIKFQQIQKYETGANRVSASRLWAIASALGVPVMHFFEGVQADGKGGTAPQAPGDELLQDARAVRLVRHFLKLPDDQKKVVLDMVTSMSQRTAEREEAGLEA